mmetsp:Transcript_10432/g.27037  ORF Transcript_10432/g.27037 Transcript_10432/m.27037 type:complete len:101 (-) Transcript_10432:390-692(-)
MDQPKATLAMLRTFLSAHSPWRPEGPGPIAGQAATIAADVLLAGLARRSEAETSVSGAAIALLLVTLGAVAGAVMHKQALCNLALCRRRSFEEQHYFLMA